MTNKRPLPPWANEYLKQWQSILYLDAWIIEASLKDFGGSPSALVTVTPDIYKAIMQFDEGSFPETLAGDEGGEIRTTIIHELLHIFTGRIGDFIEGDLLPQLSPQTREVARQTMTREIEPVIELLSRVLFDLKGDR